MNQSNRSGVFVLPTHQRIEQKGIDERRFVALRVGCVEAACCSFCVNSTYASVARSSILPHRRAAVARESVTLVAHLIG